MSSSSSSLLLPIYIVDAFTTDGNSPFTGNPAAVCFLDYDDDISDATKQKIASEINLSETAFVSYGWKNGEKLSTAEGSQLHRRTIRWFTPTTEVELCGHATVASTKALVECQLTDLYIDPEVKSIPVSFDSRFRGKLGAVWARKDTTTRMMEDRITLNFPSDPTHSLNLSEHASWLEEMIVTTLGKHVSRDSVCDVQYAPRSNILMLRLNEKNIPDDSSAGAELRKVSPNFQKLLSIDTGNFVAHDIIVTIKGEGVVSGEGGQSSESAAPHFYSRFFGPWDGIDEDPVTGLAHTVLTPYWTRELSKCLKSDEGFGVGTLLGRQHSTRGGNVYCTLVGDRVQLAGTAKITIKGQMFI